MAHCTRNKIAQVSGAGLRLFPVLPRQPTTIAACGRITKVDVANRVGISPPPCLRRVRTLEEAGYIQGYRGLLDPRRLGFDVTVFASVHLSSQADGDLRAFEDFVRAAPLVRDMRVRAGE